MSRKRIRSRSPTEFDQTEPDTEVYTRDYLHPGFDYSAPVVEYVEPGLFAFAPNMENICPSCSNVTYVTYNTYIGDAEHELADPMALMPIPANLDEIPLDYSIDEDNYTSPSAISRKLQRSEEQSDERENSSKDEKLSHNVYRPQEGYLLEKPAEAKDAKNLIKRKNI